VGGFYTGSLDPASNNLLPVFDPARAAAGAGSLPTTISTNLPTDKTAFFAFILQYLAAPPASAAAGGTLAAGTYGVGYTYVTALGETSLSIASLVTLGGGNNQIQVGAMSGIPDGVSAVNFYFTAAPAGQVGFVVQQPVSDNQTAAFAINQPGNGAAVPAIAPAGGLGFAIIDPSTGIVFASFSVPKTLGSVDWLVVNMPAGTNGHIVFQGTGTLIRRDGSTSTQRFRVTADKPLSGGDKFAITVWDPNTGSLTNPTFSVGPNTITPLPLDDNPFQSGIVIR